MTHPVTYEREGRIGLIRIENGPVNALGQAVRAGLDAAIEAFIQDGEAGIAVIYGAGRLFIGGADISEFGKPPQDPWLPEVINRIEACPKPVIAAMHSAALGGGLEVALGCHYRLAMPGTKLGLPEVTLGILPGAGGTQRTPRLTGLAKAMEMVSSGAPVTPEAALEIGLIDRIGTGDLLEDAKAYASELLAQAAPVRPVSAMPRPAADATASATIRATLAKTARGLVSPLAAVEAVEAACDQDLPEGLAFERAKFQEMMQTPQREGLIHAFFIERKVARLPEIDGIEPRTLSQIGVIGGGTMGAGIATAALLRGLSVTLIEQDGAAAEKARDTIAGNLGAAIRRSKLTEEGRDAILGRTLATATDYGELKNADLVIEAVFEDMAVKKAVFAELDRVCKPGAILATNTSYLDINEIANSISRPADVIGLHFFSPAHVMKLLEVVVADETAPDVTATAFALAKRLGKVAVRAGVCDGFIGNRILSHYRAAADRMVLAGASPFEIDRALTDFGFAMGPYAVADLAGLDIGYMTRQRKAADRDPQEVVPVWADELYHLGRLGQKTGRGYYIYEGRKGTPDPEVDEMIVKARADAGITPRTFTKDEIVRRYMAAMVNEAARVVEEEIAQRPLDVDVTLLAGYGFPRYRGGPMKWADMQGLESLLSDMESYAQDDPYFWHPAPLLMRLVAEEQTFDSLNAG
ncbi:3-hydroxyacyl-CoA dehydrogenase NAD-binding domain-containing protein [Puniceibacterium sediminis]|uniref:Short chain enoyl-CoA hydratase /3-hydroxyacyl-CoA dehydrogenase n=1 Tax=Puniceibacterium sediminis TaxID=1608407 RepID=A0A238UZ26_9RHOB|nr:3-hydroxyacyl-CoA dehydrogenase NAD-binding domain-containing protein [Puniceibacterium sediminis]SNR27445.1 short chain enoyl-CoA hydratase /3-hydroxyacyl-CoA dehydrogenase [Puniceibacterium sediminis]